MSLPRFREVLFLGRNFVVLEEEVGHRFETLLVLTSEVSYDRAVMQRTILLWNRYPVGRSDFDSVDCVAKLVLSVAVELNCLEKELVVEVNIPLGIQHGGEDNARPRNPEISRIELRVRFDHSPKPYTRTGMPGMGLSEKHLYPLIERQNVECRLGDEFDNVFRGLVGKFSEIL